MLFHEKKANLIIKRTPLLSVVLFAAVLAFLPAATVAQCAKWNASGDWAIFQGPLNRSKVNTQSDLKLQQTGTVITGTAKAFGGFYKGKAWDKTGQVDGTFVSGRFKIQIFWYQTGEIGVYEGNALESGRIQGEAWEKRSPNVRYAWHSSIRMRCM